MKWDAFTPMIDSIIVLKATEESHIAIDNPKFIHSFICAIKKHAKQEIIPLTPGF